MFSSYFYQETLQFLFTFCHKGGVICISEAIDISPRNLDFSLYFIQPGILNDVLLIKLNKQSDNIHPYCTPFPILNQSIVLCLVLIVVSWSVYKFLRRRIRWPGIPISFKNFPQFVMFHTNAWHVKIDAFLEFPSFLHDPKNVGNLSSGSFAFYKPNLYIWKFSVHVLLKPSLKDFEHNLASMGNVCNCMVVWIFCSIALLWDWNEN